MILAADRTDLANERTLLSYVRTSFTFILAGITIVKFFNTIPMYIFAGVCGAAGIGILFWGISRFNHVQNHVRQARGEIIITSTTTSIFGWSFQSIKNYLLEKIISTRALK